MRPCEIEVKGHQKNLKIFVKHFGGVLIIHCENGFCIINRFPKNRYAHNLMR